MMLETSTQYKQGSRKVVLGPILYLLCTAELMTDNNTIVSNFAEDTAVMSVSELQAETTDTLQGPLIQITR